MTLAFTICSINYLAQARTLGDTLKATNPDIFFVIGLTDILSDVLPKEKYPTYPMVEVHTIGVKNLNWMQKNYDITEFNTAVKPSFFLYFIDKYPDYQNFIYFDPDIMVFDQLDDLHQNLTTIFLTPHTCQAFPDTLTPNETDLLNAGTYNLGFCAVKRSETALNFVQWWRDKLSTQAFNRIGEGLFTDQKWINFVPHFYPTVHISKHLGYNVAYWNLHERTLNFENGKWFVNGTFPLQFFHFSGYHINNPEAISVYQNRYSFAEKQDVQPLFQAYKNAMTYNMNPFYRTIPCAYLRPKPVIRLKRVRKILGNPFRWLVKLLEKPSKG